MAHPIVLRVRHCVKATPTSRILRLDLSGAPFEFVAGQAAMLGEHALGERRPYSIACAPEEAERHGWLEFLVKLGAHGQPGAHLAGLRRGALVDVVGPMGRFSFPRHPTEHRFLFIAGGTGIAPLRSMLMHALLDRRAGWFGVLYSARTPDDFAYLPELRRLTRAGSIDLRLTVTRDAPASWRGDQGRINQSRLARLVVDPVTLCFVCGPQSLLSDVPPLLRRLGVPARRVRVEVW